MAVLAPLEYITQGRRTKLVPPTERGILNARRESFATGYRIPRPTVDAGYSHVQTLASEAALTEHSVAKEIARVKKKFYDFMGPVPGFSVLSTEIIREGRNARGLQFVYVIIVYIVEDGTRQKPEPAYARFHHDPSALAS